LPGYDDYPLKPDGEKTEVTLEILEEYIELLTSTLFKKSIKKQILEFRYGFNKVTNFLYKLNFLGVSVEKSSLFQESRA